MAETTLFKFDFADFAKVGWFTVITLIITFCMIDMFDTIGTLVGTASRAGMLDKEGKMPKMKEARYSSFDFGFGKDYEDGNMTLEALVDYAKANGEPKTTSGKQELYETILALRCK